MSSKHENSIKILNGQMEDENMQLNTMIGIENTLKMYVDKYEVGNDFETLNVFISAEMNEENKELFLNALDEDLPLGLIFTHEYKNGKLKVIFKEVQ